MSLRSPLGAVLGLGTSGGTHHWWRQRVSAVLLALLGLWFMAALGLAPHRDYTALHLWLQAPLQAVLMILFVAVSAYHSVLGLSVVIEDYVHGAALKTAMLLSVQLAHLVLGATAAFAVLKIALGSAA
jgi:succinate dehydrogenase / fumarate reductase membrane anchor subunit